MTGTLKPTRKAAAALVLSTVLMLTACQQGPSDLDPATATELQQQVSTIRTGMAAGNHAGALVDLERLSAEVEQAAGKGKISSERKTRILDAITLIRTDAQAALQPPPPQPAEPPAAPPPPPPADPKDHDKGKEEEKDKKDEPKDNKEGNGGNGEG